MDIKSAFLNDILEEEVYVEVVKGNSIVFQGHLHANKLLKKNQRSKGRAWRISIE